MSGPGGDKQRRRLVVPANGALPGPDQAMVEVEVSESFKRQFAALFPVAMNEVLASLVPMLVEHVRQQLLADIERGSMERGDQLDELRELAAARPDNVDAVETWRDLDALTFELLPEQHEGGD